MEFWTGSQGQPPLYSKYGTMPRQSLPHMYEEKRHTSDFQQPLYDRDFSSDLNWWTVPGSRTGWVLQDHTNWTEPHPPDFPFALDSQPASPQGFGNYQGHERSEREWARAEMERVCKEQENARKMQREGWVRRWEPCSPSRYRRDAKRSLSDSSYRELEAWASRYYHSLPRKRRLEAGLWGAQGGFQGGQAQERERYPQWMDRGGNFQSARPPPKQNYPMRAWGPEEGRQPAIPYRPPQSVVLQKPWEQDSKENEPKYQQRMSSQPPSYIPPPPYSAPHNSQPGLSQQPQKYGRKDAMGYIDPVLAQTHAPEGNYRTLMASVKQEVHEDMRREQLGEQMWAEEWKRTKQPELHGGQGQTDDKTWEDSTPPIKLLSDITSQPPPQVQPEITAEPKELMSPEDGKSVEVKPKKKRGRETVFCLVSRLGGVAGLSSSPEDPSQSISLPLFTVPNLTSTSDPGAGVLSSDGGGGSNSLQLADEVDSKVTEHHHQFSSPSNASTMNTDSPKLGDSSQSQIDNEKATTQRERLLGAIQTRLMHQTGSLVSAEDRESAKVKDPEVNASTERSKKVQQPHSLAKFPLWREPSLVAQAKTGPIWRCIKGNWEQQHEPAKDLSHDHGDLSFAWHDHTTDGNKEETKSYHTENNVSDGNGGIFVIDATCVVVRAEFIFPPKKEHVQYLSAANCPDSELPSEPGINNDPVVTSEQDLVLVPQECLSPGSGGDIDNESVKHKLPPQGSDSEQNIDLHESPKVENVSPSTGDSELEGRGELLDSYMPSPMILASETLEERAVRILGIPLLDSNIAEAKVVESLLDPPACSTDETQEPLESSIQEVVDLPSNLPAHNSVETLQFLDSSIQEAVELPSNLPAHNSVESQRSLGSSSQEVKSVELLSDAPAYNTSDTEESLTEVPFEEPAPEAAALSAGEDEDVICLHENDKAMDNHFLKEGQNIPGMETEERSSKEEVTLMEPAEFDAPEEDETEVFDEMQGIPKQESNFEEIPSSCVEVSQEGSSEMDDSFCVPSLSQTHCPAPTYFDSPSHCPLTIPLPASMSPSHDILQVPSPVSHSASCCSPSESPPSSSPPTRVPSPLYPVCSSSPHSDNSLSNFPSPPSTPFAPLLPTSSSPLLEFPTGSEQLSPEAPVAISPPPQSTPPLQREETQYPKSLWDAVYRIRRHTAPDSENEEEEAGEMWDNPENVSEEALIDMGSKKEMGDWNMEDASSRCEVLEDDGIDSAGGVRDQAGESTVLTESVRLEMSENQSENQKLQEEKQGEEETGGQVDDDTLSCSSSDSHTSRDTVIMGKEDEIERGGVEIREGVGDNEVRVETDTSVTTQESTNCKDEVYARSGESIEVTTEERAEENENDGKTWKENELCPTDGQFTDGNEAVLAGDNQDPAETNLEKDEERDLAIAISGEGEMGSSVCLGTLADSNVNEETCECVTAAIVQNEEDCSDTAETEGSQDIGVVAVNNEESESEVEGTCIDVNSSNGPEWEGADMEE